MNGAIYDQSGRWLASAHDNPVNAPAPRKFCEHGANLFACRRCLEATK